MQRGLPIDTFWQSSVADIFYLLDAKKQKDEADFKEDIWLRFMQARVTASYVAESFSSKHGAQSLEPWDFFPTLFADEKEDYEQQKEEERQAFYIEQMKVKADEWNKRRK